MFESACSGSLFCFFLVPGGFVGVLSSMQRLVLVVVVVVASSSLRWDESFSNYYSVQIRLLKSVQVMTMVSKNSCDRVSGIGTEDLCK